MGDYSRLPRRPDVLMFYVNGTKVTEKNADPGTTLLAYLRNKLCLTGSKLGCGEGGCGACTVMVSTWDDTEENVKHFAVNACLAPVVSVHECAVTTIEGIGSTKTKLHQVQERLANYHGSQCGFCTPGIIMSMYTLLRNKRIPTSHDIDACLQGNLCRCTGYRPILAAFQTFTCDIGDKCCKRHGVGMCEMNGEAQGYSTPYDSSQEIIFPPELQLLAQENRGRKQTLTFVGERTTWMRPCSLSELVDLKSRHPEARIAVGNTEIGIETNIKGRLYSIILCPSLISEMNTMSVDEQGVCIGSACSLSDVEDFLRKICHERSRDETQIFDAVLKMLTLFAGQQIRNVACIGGNIMTASPISDLNPIFVACGVKLTLVSATSGQREITMDGSFFTGYRKTATTQDEVLLRLKIPFLTNNDVARAFKQSKRRDDDIAIVNCAMNVRFFPDTDKVQSFSAAYGGMAAVTKVFAGAKKVVGRRWDASLLEDTCRWLNEEYELSLDAPGGMVQYRRTLVTSFFFKFYHYATTVLVDKKVLKGKNTNTSRNIAHDIATDNRNVTGTQTWQEVPETQSVDDTVGRPVQHLSASKQVTGEAQYVDDLPAYKDELHMVLVFSSRPHAKILEVDCVKALASNGVVSYVDRSDVPASNEVRGEQIFADGIVTCIGQVIGAIIADTQDHAMSGARQVKVVYEDLTPTIITIEDAIKNKSYYKPLMKIRSRNIEDGFKSCDHIIRGEIRTGGQEHFYLETQACIAIPKPEDGEMEIICSCQNPTMLQSVTAECLGVTPNKITARVKRMGGAFGGKESKFCLVTCPAVVAARKLGKPVRCMLTRQDDMQITGGRHPFLARYKIGFNNDGRIIALHNEMYSNAGNTKDLSIAVMMKAVTHCENCYNIPNVECNGYVCRTNVTSNTAFRGFGAPQAMLTAEDWISRVAAYLSKTPEQIREINMYKEGDVTHFGAKLANFHARRCWDECMQRSDFHAFRMQIELFNAENRKVHSV